MITVSILSTGNGFSVEADGHALFDKKGQDLVCCSVSTLLQSWLTACQKLAKVETEYRIKSGHLKANTGMSVETVILTQSLVLNLGILQNQYPENLKVSSEDIHGT